MPPLDFPASPSTGQTYAGPGGAVWQYDGQKWVNGASAAAVVSSFNTRTGAVTLSSGDVTTALTFTPYNATNPSGYQTAANITTALVPYATLAAPVFTGDARAVTPTAGDNDTSIATTAFVATALSGVSGGALNNVGRNLIHNPLFNVAQRGVNFTALGAYTLDRWTLAGNTDAVTISQIAASDGDRTQLGDEALSVFLRDVFTGNAAAGAWHGTQQPVESVRRLSGKTVTASFYARCLAGALKVGVNYLQQFGSGGSPSAAAWVNATGQPVTLSTTWTRYSVTTTITSTAGKTLGTNNNDSTTLALFFSSGTATNALAGNIGVQSGTIDLWGVQLEVGSVATPLEKPDPQQDLAKCQRFFQAISLISAFYGVAGSGAGAAVMLPVVMRGAPVVTLTNNANANVSSLTVGADAAKAYTSGGTATATGTVWISQNATLSADL